MDDETIERAISYGYHLASKSSFCDEDELKSLVNITVAKALANPPDVIKYPYTFLTNRIRWRLTDAYRKHQRQPEVYSLEEYEKGKADPPPTWAIERQELIERVKKRYPSIPDAYLTALIVEGQSRTEAARSAGAYAQLGINWAKKVGRLL